MEIEVGPPLTRKKVSRCLNYNSAYASPKVLKDVSFLRLDTWTRYLKLQSYLYVANTETYYQNVLANVLLRKCAIETKPFGIIILHKQNHETSLLALGQFFLN